MSNQYPYLSPYDPDASGSQPANQPQVPQPQAGDAQPPCRRCRTRVGHIRGPHTGRRMPRRPTPTRPLRVFLPPPILPARTRHRRSTRVVASARARGTPRRHGLLFLRRDVRLWHGTDRLDPHQVRRRARLRPRHDPPLCWCTAQRPHGERTGRRETGTNTAARQGHGTLS